METSPQTVFVLGAGFTRAFFKNAPLVVDHHYANEIREKTKTLPQARLILESELARHRRGEIDLERLMTRLHEGVPYDALDGSRQERELLMAHLKSALLRGIEEARQTGTEEGGLLRQLACYCIDHRITCITFNYDDFLDEALYTAHPYNGPEYCGPCWHPDNGYGFYCRPSLVCVHDGVISSISDVAMCLLKLHGSVNWKVRLGSVRPYGLEAVVHHQAWARDPTFMWMSKGKDPHNVEAYTQDHLEAEPLIVLPVLTKGELLHQPVMRRVWSAAYQAMTKAEAVFFIGYSMPVTDIAARALFAESLARLDAARIKIINKKADKWEQRKLRLTYERAMGKTFPKQSFVWDGACEWAKTLVKTGFI